MPLEVAQGVYRLETDYLDVCGFPLWLHLVVDGEDVVLLDSGVASTPEATLRGELATLGLDLTDLTRVVNSHAHPDHMGGNAALRALTSARIAGPASEVDWLEDNDQLIRELWDADPEAFRLEGEDLVSTTAMLGERVRMDDLLRDGDVLTVGASTLQVVTTSGHSPGHIAIWAEDTATLFTFDDVQGAGTQVPGTGTVLAPLYHDVERYRSGLRRLFELDFDRLVPSHGPILSADQGRARIAESLDWVDRAHETVRNAVDSKGTALRDVAVAIGTVLGPYGGINLQTTRVARAHLDKLTRDGELAPQWFPVGDHTTGSGTPS